MVRILIAEDEAIERHYLAQLLESLEHQGICVCASCADGEEAVQEAQIHMPDILIMDIEMPNMNGLEAVREIRKVLPEVRTLILTAFGEFEYAKTAIQLGVDDYFVKPGSDEELLEKIISLVAQVDKSREKQDHLLFVEEQLKQYNRILMEEMMVSMMFMREEAKQYFTDYLQLQRMEPIYFSCCIVRTMEDAYCDVITEIREILYRKGLRCATGQCHQEFVFLILSQKDARFAGLKEEILHQLMRISGSRFLCEISPVFQDPEDILKACHQAKGQIEQRIGKSQVEPLQEIIQRYEASWMEAAVSGNRLDCRKEAIAFSEQFLYQKEAFSQARDGAYLLYMMLTRDISQFFNREIMFGNGDDIRQRIHQTRNIQTLQNVVRDYLEEILTITQEEKQKKQDKLVLMVAEYLKEHFHENLSLNSVAEEFCMSSFHLSKMFRKTMKKNFIEYLTELRVQQARTLLMDGTRTITEVAFMVGYQDSGYFSKVFRKATGLSPREFSESVSKKN